VLAGLWQFDLYRQARTRAGGLTLGRLTSATKWRSNLRKLLRQACGTVMACGTVLTGVRMSCREVPFKKMYGLGNDFIVLDARKDPSVRHPPPSFFRCEATPLAAPCLPDAMGTVAAGLVRVGAQACNLPDRPQDGHRLRPAHYHGGPRVRLLCICCVRMLSTQRHASCWASQR